MGKYIDLILNKPCGVRNCQGKMLLDETKLVGLEDSKWKLNIYKCSDCPVRMESKDHNYIPSPGALRCRK